VPDSKTDEILHFDATDGLSTRQAAAIIKRVGATKVTADTGSGRELRRDAAANRDRVLAAAAAAVRREGSGVPLATIAADAGVGVGTLYRRYPSRDALLAALTHRSFRLVLAAAQRAADSGTPAILSLRGFLEETIAHGGDLVLPMHGGPVLLDSETATLRAEVRETLERVLRRGRRDGSIRRDVTATDIILFGALLAQPLPHVPDWKQAARRQARIYLDGLAPAGAR
jgi:AcrR family transcriptional regulator